MALEADFNDALERSKAMKTQSIDVQLNLYGLFKQATIGDAHDKRPGMLDIRGRAKYDAWAERSGMSKDAAMESYIKEIDALEA